MSRKNKYYMRGVGVGILVCALILIFSRMNTGAVISDEEVISRARELGMIESGEQSLTEATSVSDVTESPQEPSVSASPETTPEPEITASPEETGEPYEDPSPEPSPDASEEPSPEASPEPSPEETPSDEDDPLLTDLVYVTLTIYGGNSSDTVARRAEELGLVTNAKEFDEYLVSNGYANRIRVGSFQIPLGASYEYIAKAIT
ncbi:MAG: hypothetical protein KBG42_10765 [Lachnospiraceae bacterium]|nr:hypothetical protein [Lachnospiraceae bacterium]